MGEWDFEGEMDFLSAQEGGRTTPAFMGYFPSFRYPEFEEGGQFIAKPVLGFRPDGTLYDDGEPLDAHVLFRFRFLRRDWYETIHRARLVPGCRFELMEGFRTTARGTVHRKRDDVPPIEADIKRLVSDLGDAVPCKDAKEVLAFLYHREWECAADLLWWTLGVSKAILHPDEDARLVDIGRRSGMDLDHAVREWPLSVREP